MQITKEIINELFYNSEKNKYNSARMNESYCDKHNIPYNEILHFYDDSESFFESVYRIINDINKRPICKVCGKILNFNRNDKFRTFCSAACSTHDPDVLAKNKAGVSKSLKKAYEERGNEIKAKRAAALGNESGSPFENKDVQEKIKQTVKERYGVDNVFRLKEFRGDTKAQVRMRSVNLWKSRGYDIEYIDDNTVVIKNGCKIHGDILLTPYQFTQRMTVGRLLPDLSNVCLQCKPWGDRHESSIEIIIKQILDKYCIKYEQHNRSLISPQELDFYLPDYNIAIECNGVWWHSSNYVKEADYHINKRLACEKLGIKLLSFWEYVIYDNTEKVEAYLKLILGLNEVIENNRVIIKQIDVAEAIDFHNSYNIYNTFSDCDINYGVYLADELIKVLSITVKEKWLYKITRISVKDNYTVNNDKEILDIFKNEYSDWKEIYGWQYHDLTHESLYQTLGFISESTTPQLFYLDKPNRQMLTKEDIDNAYKYIPEEDLMEHLYQKRILTCYNSGVTKWRLTNKQS